MKQLLKYALMIVASVSVLSLASCSKDDDDDKSAKKPLVGSWVSADGETITFNEDGSAIIDGEEALWTLDGSKLVITYPDGEEIECEVKIENGKVNMTFEEDGEKVQVSFTEEKKPEPVEPGSSAYDPKNPLIGTWVDLGDEEKHEHFEYVTFLADGSWTSSDDDEGRGEWTLKGDQLTTRWIEEGDDDDEMTSTIVVDEKTLTATHEDRGHTETTTYVRANGTINDFMGELLEGTWLFDYDNRTLTFKKDGSGEDSNYGKLTWSIDRGRLKIRNSKEGTIKYEIVRISKDLKKINIVGDQTIREIVMIKL